MFSIFRGRVRKASRGLVGSTRSLANEQISRLLHMQTTIANNWTDRFGYSFKPRFQIVTSSLTRWYNVNEIRLSDLMNLKVSFPFLENLEVNFETSSFETATTEESQHVASANANECPAPPDPRLEDESSITHLTALSESSVRAMATIIGLLRYIRTLDTSVPELTYSFSGGGKDMLVSGMTRWTDLHLRMLHGIRGVADVHFDLTERITRFSLRDVSFDK